MKLPFALALLVSAPVLAHLEIDAGKLPFVVDGRVIGGQSSWGLVLPEGDGLFRVCDEAFSPVMHFAQRSADGAIFAGGIDGLYVSVDAGCSYEQVAGALAGRSVNGFALGTRSIAVSGTFNGPNGIWSSDDGGETWDERLAPTDGFLFFQVAASAASDAVVVTGTDAREPVAAPLVVTSNDGGITYAEASAGYASFLLVRAILIDDDTSSMLFGGFAEDGTGILLSTPLAEPTAPVQIGTFPSEVTHAAIFGGATFVLTRFAGVVYRKGAGDADFVPVTTSTSGPTDCLFLAPAGDRLIGCGKRQLNAVGMFMESADGTTWTRSIAFEGLEYRHCAEGTIGQTACASYVESACENGEDDDVDGSTDCEDSDCGCVPVAGEGEGEGEGDPRADEQPSGRERATRSAGCSTSQNDGTLVRALLGLLILRRCRTRRAAHA